MKKRGSSYIRANTVFLSEVAVFSVCIPGKSRKKILIAVVPSADRGLRDVQRGGLPGQDGPYGERQGVPEMGLCEASQTPLPAQEVSCRLFSRTHPMTGAVIYDANSQEEKTSPVVMIYCSSLPLSSPPPPRILRVPPGTGIKT